MKIGFTFFNDIQLLKYHQICLNKKRTRSGQKLIQ
jgi:hypothetical protein